MLHFSLFFVSIVCFVLRSSFLRSLSYCVCLFGSLGNSHVRLIFNRHANIRGGSKNFSKGGLYTILITFNANDVEVE